MRTLLLAAFLLMPTQELSPSPSYVVVFELRQLGPASPTVRVNCVATGNSEGEATIKAFKYLSENAFPGALDKLAFIEAQRR